MRREPEVSIPRLGLDGGSGWGSASDSEISEAESDDEGIQRKIFICDESIFETNFLVKLLFEELSDRFSAGSLKNTSEVSCIGCHSTRAWSKFLSVNEMNRRMDILIPNC